MRHGPVSGSQTSWKCFYPDPYIGNEYRYEVIRNFARAGHGEIQRCNIFMGPWELIEASALVVAMVGHQFFEHKY